MDSEKQTLFMERVLFLFEITKAKAGKAQTLRLSLQQWLVEADVACLAGDIMFMMGRATNADHVILFPVETMKLVRQRFIEGTFGIVQCFGIVLF